MTVVDIREAKTPLSRLIDRALGGEEIVIAVSGKPVVKLLPIDASVGLGRVGFLAGQIRVPDDFDRLGEREIVEAFEAGL
ncbi:MAG: type II toxin-antitoxin system prevent-host-death family antitoxin [Chloroflexota bacterium]